MLKYYITLVMVLERTLEPEIILVKFNGYAPDYFYKKVISMINTVNIDNLTLNEDYTFVV